MVDEAFGRTDRELDERCCPFAKGILTNQAGCSRARRLCIGEREDVSCGHDEAQARCLAFLHLMRGQARFALKTADGQGALTHAKAMRIQMGGLRGVRAALTPDAPSSAAIVDINGLLSMAIARLGGFDRLPWPILMRHVAAYQGRQPSRR